MQVCRGDANFNPSPRESTYTDTEAHTGRTVGTSLSTSGLSCPQPRRLPSKKSGAAATNAAPQLGSLWNLKDQLLVITLSLSQFDPQLADEIPVEEWTAKRIDRKLYLAPPPAL